MLVTVIHVLKCNLVNRMMVGASSLSKGLYQLGLSSAANDKTQNKHFLSKIVACLSKEHNLDISGSGVMEWLYDH